MADRCLNSARLRQRASRLQFPEDKRNRIGLVPPIGRSELRIHEGLSKVAANQFGGIDILVNNTAIAYGPNGDGDFVNEENARAIIDTNYYGVKNVTEVSLPLLRPSPTAARIVNVTSGLGLYERLRSETLKQTFRDEDSYTQEFVDSMAKKYLEDVKEDRWNEEGWVGGEGRTFPMYSVSEILLNAYSIALASSLSKSQQNDHQILVATFNPGVTATDMLFRSFKEGVPEPAGFRAKTPAEGANTGVWWALLPKEDLADKHGKFFVAERRIVLGVWLRSTEFPHHLK